MLIQAPALAAPAQPVKKTARDVIEEHQLDSPANSQEFAKYYQNHAKKVKAAKSCLSTVSTLLMVVSLTALFFCLMSFMTPKQAGNAHRLKASNGPAEGNAEMQTMLTAISSMLWGLVAAKAKQGMAASKSSKSTSVGSMMKSVSSLTMLIVMGSLVKFGAEVIYVTPSVDAPATHKLQAAHESVTRGVWPPPEQFIKQDHLESFYDESSSHFMGGAANVALSRF